MANEQKKHEKPAKSEPEGDLPGCGWLTDKGSLGQNTLDNVVWSQTQAELLSDPMDQVAEQFIYDRLTPLTSRLELAPHRPARASWWSLVTEKRIR